MFRNFDGFLAYICEPVCFAMFVQSPVSVVTVMQTTRALYLLDAIRWIFSPSTIFCIRWMNFLVLYLAGVFVYVRV